MAVVAEEKRARTPQSKILAYRIVVKEVREKRKFRETPVKNRGAKGEKTNQRVANSRKKKDHS